MLVSIVIHLVAVRVAPPAKLPAVERRDFKGIVEGRRPLRAPEDLRQAALEGLARQEKDMEVRHNSDEARLKRGHMLVEQVTNLSLDPSAPDFAQRVDDRFQALGPTGKCLMKYLYKHAMQVEAPVDAHLVGYNKKYSENRIEDEKVLYLRVLNLALLGLIEIRAVAARTTVARTIPEVQKVLVDRKRLDS